MWLRTKVKEGLFSYSDYDSDKINCINQIRMPANFLIFLFNNKKKLWKKAYRLKNWPFLCLYKCKGQTTGTRGDPT